MPTVKMPGSARKLLKKKKYCISYLVRAYYKKYIAFHVWVLLSITITFCVFYRWLKLTDIVPEDTEMILYVGYT